MEKEYKPYIERKARDFVTAKDWNDMQGKIREHIDTHGHTGKAFDSRKLGGEEPLHITGDLKVDGKIILGEVDDLMEQIKGMIKKATVIEKEEGYPSTLPVGSIIAWHRDLLGESEYTPELPPGWVRCDGQTLDDPESLFNGCKIPNLNGEGRFLRGGEKSGVEQDDAFQEHEHKIRYYYGEKKGSTYARWIVQDHSGTPSGKICSENISGDSIFLAVKPAPDDSLGCPNPRTDKETRPINMSVIWIMKVKQVAAIQAHLAVQAHQNAPQGTIYINEKGNVNIRSSSVKSTLIIQGIPANNQFQGSDVIRITGNNSLSGNRLSIGWSDKSERTNNMIQIGVEVKDGSDSGKGDFYIATRDNTLDSEPTERMRITEDGKVGIGTPSPEATLQVRGSVNSWSIKYPIKRNHWFDTKIPNSFKTDLFLIAGNIHDAVGSYNNFVQVLYGRFNGIVVVGSSAFGILFKTTEGTLRVKMVQSDSRSKDGFYPFSSVAILKLN